jgi:hypothetical protein
MDQQESAGELLLDKGEKVHVANKRGSGQGVALV